MQKKRLEVGAKRRALFYSRFYDCNLFVFGVIFEQILL